MIHSKTIQLLRTFSEDEFRKFGLFLSSPYFNKENIQIRFYEIIKKYYPDFNNRNFEKEKLYLRLYPGKKYNDSVMRNILSGMLELAEHFLVIGHQQKKDFNYMLALMRELSERKIGKLFEKAELKAAAIMESEIARNEQYYYDSFLLLNEKRMYVSRKKSALYIDEEFSTEIIHSLTISFIINILKYNTYLANSNLKMFKFDYDTGIMNELESYLEKEAERFKDVTYIQLYYNAIKLAKTEDEQYFYAIRKIAYNEYKRLSDVEKRNIFTFLTNFCYFKINKGELKFRKEHFLLHKERIEKGYFKGLRHFLDHIQYQNVVITGLDAGEIDWVEKFIEQFKADLDEINRENSYNLCRSLLFYHNKQYDEALKWAASVKTDDLSYKHQLKSLYLKIYFDMNETEPFYSHIDSYRHFLLNEKHIPEITRNVINSYVNYTKKLFDIKSRITEKDYDLFKIRNDISDSKAMINKSWLLERIDKIEKKLL